MTHLIHIAIDISAEDITWYSPSMHKVLDSHPSTTHTPPKKQNTNPDIDIASMHKKKNTAEMHTLQIRCKQAPGASVIPSADRDGVCSQGNDAL